VNRGQFISSLYISSADKLECTYNYCSSSIDFGGKNLVLFDFFSYLKNLFQFSDTGSSDLAIVIKTDILSDKARSSVRSLVSDSDSTLDSGLVSIKMGNSSSIENISLKTIKPVPECIRKSGARGGILGVRFVNSKSIQFFIDLDVMLTSMMAGLI
jgi:hypothetical protein